MCTEKHLKGSIYTFMSFSEHRVGGAETTALYFLTRSYNCVREEFKTRPKDTP